jgi:hypothetical protein
MATTGAYPQSGDRRSLAEMVHTGNSTVCDAGHALPCPICGATDERDFNGGQYFSPQLRTPPRTERQAAQSIRRRNRITEQEREARDGR